MTITPTTTYEETGFATITRLPGERTGEAFTIVETVVAPGKLVAPLHTHRQDEAFLVVAGEIGLLVGDEELRAREGDLLVGPAGVPHTFWNDGEEEARVFLYVWPAAGFDHYFEGLSDYLTDEGELDPEGLAEYDARFGIEADYDSIPMLVERFSVAP